MKELADEITDRLRAAGDAKRREVATWYFPTAMEVLGVPTPAMRLIVRDVAARMRKGPPTEVLTLAQTLVDEGTMEGRSVAYELVERRRDALALLGPRTLRALGRGNDNWASVDCFSCGVAGPAWNAGRIDDATIATWAHSPDRWWRRTALASTVALNTPARGGRGDASRTIVVCETLVGDHEDMVVKALSWALRALTRFDEKAVKGFLVRHREVVHKRVIREVESKLTTGHKTAPKRR